MTTKYNVKLWLANLTLFVCSSLFIFPLLWLLLTALKPIEQTMKFQWLPKRYLAPIEERMMPVIKEREITEESVLVIIQEGPRKDEKLILSHSSWDGSFAWIEEIEADKVLTVRRKVEKVREVHRGWWKIREKFFRKYAEVPPRWDCVPEDQIEESIWFWWENFVLAVEYLSETKELPLSFKHRIRLPPNSLPDQPNGTTRLSLQLPYGHSLNLTQYDFLRCRLIAEERGDIILKATTPDGSIVTIKRKKDIEAGTHDLNIPLGKAIHPTTGLQSIIIKDLWFEIPNIHTDKLILSEARLIQYRATFWTYLGNTLTICFLGCFGTVLSSSLVAYGFSRLKWSGRDHCFWLVLATMMVPFPVTMVPLFAVFKELHWIGTLKPLWVPAFFGSAFNIFLLRQFFMTIPQDISDAARIDGCSELGIYWYMILPLSKPALSVVVLFHFLYAWNDFLGPLIYLTKPETFTLSLALQFFQSQHGGSEWHLLMAMSILILAPIVVLFFFTQKTFVQGIATTGIKG